MEMEMRETTTKARWAISCFGAGVMAWRKPRRVRTEQGSLNIKADGRGVRLLSIKWKNHDVQFFSFFSRFL